jgi:hypothetical protein
MKAVLLVNTAAAEMLAKKIGWNGSNRGLTAGHVPEENVCDGLGDRKAGIAFEPEEFARRIEFEKDVSAIGGKNDVDRAVVQ